MVTLSGLHQMGHIPRLEKTVDNTFEKYPPCGDCKYATCFECPKFDSNECSLGYSLDRYILHNKS